MQPGKSILPAPTALGTIRLAADWLDDIACRFTVHTVTAIAATLLLGSGSALACGLLAFGANLPPCHASEVTLHAVAQQHALVRPISSRVGNRVPLPKVGDYGTHMDEIDQYIGALKALPVAVCERAARQGDPDGAYCAARRAKGERTPALLRKAARLGHPLAQNDLAMLLDREDHSTEVVALIRASSAYGIPHAQVTMGWWYMKGLHGFEIDYRLAMDWNLKGFQQGHSEGANNIGELFEHGHGVTMDVAQAVVWYRMAAAMGSLEAMERLVNISRMRKDSWPPMRPWRGRVVAVLPFVVDAADHMPLRAAQASLGGTMPDRTRMPDDFRGIIDRHRPVVAAGA